MTALLAFLTMNHCPEKSLEERIIERLSKASLYQTYRRAFQLATGLELVVYPATEGEQTQNGGFSGNRFCRMLNSNGGCRNCIIAQECLFESSQEQTTTTRCFARMQESAVPLKVGLNLVGYLRIGQVFTTVPEDFDFEQITQELKNAGHSPKAIRKLKEAFFESRVMDPDQYRACLTMISVFAQQLKF